MTHSGPADDALWAYAVELYGSDANAAACLELQDEHGLNVPTFLACVWAAIDVGVTDGGLVQSITDASAEWDTTVVTPLRSVRRALAAPIGQFGHSEQQSLRLQIAEVELLAERSQLFLLQSVITGLEAELPGAPKRRVGRFARHLRAWPQSEAILTDSRAVESISTLISAATPDLGRAEVRAILAESSRPDPSLDTKTASGLHATTRAEAAGPPRGVALSLLQVSSPSDEPRQDRLERVSELVMNEASEHHPDVIVLPELWPTGFFHFDRYRADAETLDGPTAMLLSELASASGSWLFGGSLIERGSHDRLHNTSVCFSPAGEMVGHYRKIHLFGYESEEARTLTPGDRPTSFDTPFGRIGVTTCYDLRFPELYRELVDDDVVVIVVCSAWPEARREHWELLNRARAVENLAWVIACNASGVQSDTPLAGSSLIVSPWGEVTGPAGHTEVWVRATIDPQEAHGVRERFPALRDRR